MIFTRLLGLDMEDHQTERSLLPLDDPHPPPLQLPSHLPYHLLLLAHRLGPLPDEIDLEPELARVDAGSADAVVEGEADDGEVGDGRVGGEEDAGERGEGGVLVLGGRRGVSPGRRAEGKG